MCLSFRFRQELSNEYLLAKFGVDTAENESSKISHFIPTQAISFHIRITPWLAQCWACFLFLGVLAGSVSGILPTAFPSHGFTGAVSAA